MEKEMRKKIVSLKKSLNDEFLTTSEKQKIKKTIESLENQLTIGTLDKSMKNFIKNYKKQIKK